MNSKPVIKQATKGSMTPQTHTPPCPREGWRIKGGKKKLYWKRKNCKRQWNWKYVGWRKCRSKEGGRAAGREERRKGENGKGNRERKR